MYYQDDAPLVSFDRLSPQQQSRYAYEGQAFDEGDEPITVECKHFR